MKRAVNKQAANKEMTIVLAGLLVQPEPLSALVLLPLEFPNVPEGEGEELGPEDGDECEPGDGDECGPGDGATEGDDELGEGASSTFEGPEL